MKLLLTGLLTVAMLATGCSKKDSTPDPSPDATAFPQVLTQGSWVVSSYVERTEDKTNSMAGIRFTFNPDGTATAVQSSDNTPGTWRWGGNGYYGTPQDSKTLTLAFGTRKPFDRLSDSWTILEGTNTTIKLDNFNPAEDEHLVFVH